MNGENLENATLDHPYNHTVSWLFEERVAEAPLA